jgi:lipopolysaccharide export system protein LptA
MRRTRWLFLAAILGILASVGATYFSRKGRLEKDAPVPPQPLEATLDARSQSWCYSDNSGAQRKYLVCSGKMRQIKEPSLYELEDVDLRLFHKEGSEYDLIRCAKAQFDTSAKTLYSDGDIEITLALPTDGPPHGHIVKVHSSGVTIQSETGKASTDRKAVFDFDEGGGSAVGAEYDPQIRELHLRSQVSLDWLGKTPGAVPMHIEAGEAFYHERDSNVLLIPWATLTRDTLHMEAGTSLVDLDHGDIRDVKARNAHGVKDDPDRKVEFGADFLTMNFGDGMQVSKIVGDDHGRLVSTAQTMRTTVTADHLDLDFEANGGPSGKESTLATALATGSSATEAQPLPKPGTEVAETRILRSDSIRLKMKPGGKDIDNVETAGPGTIDFVPNRPGQPKRWMKGDRIWIAYGAENRIQSLRSINVSTRTDKPPQPGQPDPPPALTGSKEIFATFDPKTSDLTDMEQKTDFHYEEGLRHARADRATLAQQQDLMTLDGSARMWDDTGSASADRIVMNQKTGDFTAEGHVASTRQPDKNGKSSAMLATDQVMQARAQRMVSTDNNLKIHYEGNAVAWQGANRVEADTLDIDRDRQVMEAHGKVVSQFVDKDKSKPADGSAPAPAKPATAPIFTVVRAPDMVYTEDTRIVVYTGGVVLKRPDLSVTGKEIQAFLKDASADSSLDKAFADGTVKIVSTSDKLRRTRTGTSDHAEYYADEEKVILQKGDPLLVDSYKGQTRGRQLTWWANDDRLLIDGKDKASPTRSTIRKR